MNALTRWDPFRELEEMQGRLSSLLGRSNNRRVANHEKEAITVPDWSPLADILENEAEYVIRAEVTGVDQKDVSVRMENRTLILSGERRLAPQENRVHRLERAYGSFSRSFLLPEAADSDKIQARFHGGLLEVRVAKTEAARPREITVQSE